MLSKQKVAAVLLDWLRDKLADTSGSQSLKDDADGVAVYVDEATVVDGSLVVSLAVVSDPGGRQKSYDFTLRTGPRSLPVSPGVSQRSEPTPSDLAELDNTA